MKKLHKVLSVILIVALALMAFGGLGGCSGKQKPLRILVDIEGAYTTYPDLNQNASCGDFLADNVKLLGGPEDIEIEVIPAEGAERDVALTRVRTEVMAGGGPDVFIVSSATAPNPEKMRLTRLRTEIMAGEGPDVFIMRCADNPTPNNQAQSSLFLEPEKIMENGLLLPLDDYIKNARYMEWDKLTPQIMEAGRHERYGQVILPLSYQVPVVYFNGEEILHTPSADTTWADMLADEVLRGAAAQYDKFNFIIGDVVFGDLADYAEDRLAFTEEELAQQLDELNRLFESRRAEEDASAAGGPQGVSGYLAYDFRQQTAGSAVSLGDTVTMVPLYNRTGGVTAVVDGYAAINGNTKRPKDAFLILDLLLSGEGQKKYTVSRDLIAEGMPVYEYEDGQYTGAALGQDNMKALQGVRAAVTQVNFRGTLSYELAMLHMKYRWIANGWAFGDVSFSESSVDEAVRTTYSRMQQEIAE